MQEMQMIREPSYVMIKELEGRMIFIPHPARFDLYKDENGTFWVNVERGEEITYHTVSNEEYERLLKWVEENYP